MLHKVTNTHHYNVSVIRNLIVSYVTATYQSMFQNIAVT